MTLTTRHLVEASATVVTVTNLKRGDVYKRLVESSASGDSKLQIGIVSDVLHNGEAAAISALEYVSDYAGVRTEPKVFKTEDAPLIFAAHAEEVRGIIGDMIGDQQRKIRNLENDLAKLRGVLGELERLSGVELTDPTTITSETPVSA